MMADAEPATGDARSPARLFALKQGDTFVVADAFGDITGEGDGLFHDDTRLLSRFRLSIGGRPLELLGGAVSEDNVVFTANLTNRPLPPIGGQSTRQGVIHIERTRLIWEDRLYERLRLRNFGQAQAQLPLRLEFAADFRDMFEVRGLTRAARGRVLAAAIDDDSAVLSYEGLDGLVLASTLTFGQRPTHLAPGFADFALTLPPNLRTDIFYEVGHGRRRATLAPALPRPRRPKRGWQHGRSGVAAPGCRPPAACSASGSAGRGPIWPCSPPSSRPAPTPMPASPGSRPRSAATPSSPPCSSCGSIRRWRAACCASWRRTRPPRPRASPTPRPARSCTRPARARWRACASCRSANTMAASTPRRCSSCWPAPMPPAPAIWL